MRVSNVGNARPQYYDRNPLPKSLFFSGFTNGPQAALVVKTYTVPVNRKAFMGYCFVYSRRSIQTTTPNVTILQIQYTPSGGGVTVLMQVKYVDGLTNHVFQQASGMNVELNAGEQVNIEIEDDSTGGQIEWFATTHLIEFDA